VSVGREPPFSSDLSLKLEESPLLETVATERLVKTQQAGKCLAGAVMICEMWRLAVTLQLLVVPSCVYKWSKIHHPFQNPVDSNSYKNTSTGAQSTSASRLHRPRKSFVIHTLHLTLIESLNRGRWMIRNVTEEAINLYKMMVEVFQGTE
jgi:hypothetical protein